MFQAERQEQRRAVEAELGGPECLRLLRKMRDEAGLWKAAETWREAIAGLNQTSPDDPRRDEALRALFMRRLAEPGDGPAVETVMLAVFWFMLEAIHTEKHSWERDAEVRWCDLLWSFFRAVRRLHPERRSQRISGKIYCDTVHGLYRECQRRWIGAAREVPHDPAAAAEMADRKAAGAPPDREARRLDAVERIHGFRKAGVINDEDMSLLLDIVVAGLSLKEAAAKAGVSYEAAKKRKQRAEAAILKELGET